MTCKACHQLRYPSGEPSRVVVWSISVQLRCHQASRLSGGQVQVKTAGQLVLGLAIRGPSKNRMWSAAALRQQRWAVRGTRTWCGLHRQEAAMLASSCCGCWAEACWCLQRWAVAAKAAAGGAQQRRGVVCTGRQQGLGYLG